MASTPGFSTSCDCKARPPRKVLDPGSKIAAHALAIGRYANAHCNICSNLPRRGRPLQRISLLGCAQVGGRKQSHGAESGRMTGANRSMDANSRGIIRGPWLGACSCSACSSTWPPRRVASNSSGLETLTQHPLSNGCDTGTSYGTMPFAHTQEQDTVTFSMELYSRPCVVYLCHVSGF